MHIQRPAMLHFIIKNNTINCKIPYSIHSPLKTQKHDWEYPIHHHNIVALFFTRIPPNNSYYYIHHDICCHCHHTFKDILAGRAEQRDLSALFFDKEISSIQKNESIRWMDLLPRPAITNSRTILFTSFYYYFISSRYYYQSLSHIINNHRHDDCCKRKRS